MSLARSPAHGVVANMVSGARTKPSTRRAGITACQRPPETSGGQVGFRPILEHLDQYLEVKNGDVSTSICVYGPDWSKITGTLLGFSDYDLTLKIHNLLFGNWADALRALDEQTVVIDRSKLKWITKDA